MNWKKTKHFSPQNHKMKSHAHYPNIPREKILKSHLNRDKTE